MSLTVARSLRSTVYGGDFGLSNFFYNSEVGGVIDLAPLDTSWRRNLQTFTEQFGHASWAKIRSSFVENATIAPDGTLSADKLVENTDATQSHYLNGQYVEVAGLPTVSVYLKAAERSWAAVQVVRDNGIGTASNMALANLVLGTTNFGSIEDVGDGWFRLSITATIIAATNYSIRIFASDLGVTNYTGDGTSGIYVWGAQLEQGALTPYQPITDFHTEVRAMHPAAKLFQDTSGLQPVTAPGQTVALALMKGAREVEARRNLLAYTEEFDNAAWTKVRGTISSNATVGGDGTLTADKFVEDVSVTQSHVMGRNLDFVSGVVYTFSIEVEAAGRTHWAFVFPGSSFTTSRILFDLTAITAVTTLGPATGTITALGGGRFRCTATATATITSSGFFEVRLSNGVTDSYTGDGVSGIYVWGAQLELGAVATPYQKVITGADGSWTPGQHFVQSSASLRPTYAVRPKGGRRNLLTRSEDFTSSPWMTFGTVVRTANTAVAPDGTLSADTLAISASSGVYQNIFALPSTTYTVSVWLRADAPTTASLVSNTNPSDPTFLSVAVTTTWQRISLPKTTNGTATVINLQLDSTYGANTIYVWGAQVNVGSTATPYQRVTTIYDVYEAGKTHYGALWFDGVDDFMVSGTVTPGTDKVQVFAGVRKNSDAAIGILIESSANSNGNNGAFFMLVPSSPLLPNYRFRSKGTLVAEAGSGDLYPAGSSAVFMGTGDMAGDLVRTISNAGVVTSSAQDQGTGGFLAYPIYMGRRGGTSLPFNGEIEALIGYRFGPNLSDTQLTQIATFINSRTGAY